jgi:hypothetical protein
MTARNGQRELEQYFKNWGSNPPQLRSPFSIDNLPNYRLALALLAVGTPSDELSLSLTNNGMFSPAVLSFRKKKTLIRAMRKMRSRADEYLSLLELYS